MIYHLAGIGNQTLQSLHFLIDSTSPPLPKNQITTSTIKYGYYQEEEEEAQITFSDKLCTSAALFLLELEVRAGASFGGSSDTSTPSYNEL